MNLLLLVLTLIVTICLLCGFSSRDLEIVVLPIMTIIHTYGLIWFGFSLILLWNRSKNTEEERDGERTQQANLLNYSAPAASAPAPPVAFVEIEAESESIYENANELFQKTQL